MIDDIAVCTIHEQPSRGSRFTFDALAGVMTHEHPSRPHGHMVDALAVLSSLVLSATSWLTLFSRYDSRP